uniref:Uncharacterized protein n=1 Tax=Alexandrium monilatum TaxID=311494 RepID=A0A7S4PYH7_9DINO
MSCFEGCWPRAGRPATRLADAAPPPQLWQAPPPRSSHCGAAQPERLRARKSAGPSAGLQRRQSSRSPLHPQGSAGGRLPRPPPAAEGEVVVLPRGGQERASSLFELDGAPSLAEMRQQRQGEIERDAIIQYATGW